MQRNEPFRSDITSASLPVGIVFREAVSIDTSIIFELMAGRSPSRDRKELLINTKKEVEERSDGKRYGLFVAELEGEVLGFCRYLHSDDIPEEKVKFEINYSGFYTMGTLVARKWRRNGIARFLSEERFKWLRALGVDEVYSGVALDNPASIRMHESFGYEEVYRSLGFLTVRFDCGEGILFRKKL